MTGSELSQRINYLTQERQARALLIEKNIKTERQVALMTIEDVCGALLEKYQVVACGGEDIILIDKDFVNEYEKHIEHLRR